MVPKRSTRERLQVDQLFVYGTLREGQTARALLADHVAAWRPATAAGRIYAFPLGYPGFVDGDGTVIGELVTLRELPAAFALLDAYESADYHRDLRPVAVDGASTMAWIYLLRDQASVESAEWISDGDWVRYWTELLD